MIAHGNVDDEGMRSHPFFVTPTVAEGFTDEKVTYLAKGIRIALLRVDLSATLGMTNTAK